MRKTIYLIAAILTLGACHPKAVQSLEKHTESTQEKDSSHLEKTVTIRDTVVKIQPDSSAIGAEVIAGQNGEINLPQIITETPASKASVSISNGRLAVKCLCKEQELKLKLYENQIREYASRKSEKAKESVKITTVTKEVRYVPWWAKILSAIGAICLLILTVIFIVKLKTYHNG